MRWSPVGASAKEASMHQPGRASDGDGQKTLQRPAQEVVPLHIAENLQRPAQGK